MAYEPFISFRMGDVEDPDLYLGMALYDKFGDIWNLVQPMLEKECCAKYRIMADPTAFGHRVLIEIDWWNKEEELIFKLKHGPFPIER